MNLYYLIKKLTVARQNGFMFNQINKLTEKFYSHLRYINLSYHLKSQIPMCHTQFFGVISQNRDYVEIFAMIEIILSVLHVRNGIKIVCHFITSILFLFQHNFIISRLVMYKTEYDV